MTASNNPNESEWLLQPPGPNEIQFQIAVGDGVEVSDDVRQALEDLMSKLQFDDVEGFGISCEPRCRTLANCGTKTCKPLNNCTELTVKPCLADMRCIIQTFT